MASIKETAEVSRIRSNVQKGGLRDATAKLN